MAGFHVLTTTGADTAIEEAAVAAFKTNLRGELLRPGAPGDDDARKFLERDDRQTTCADRPLRWGGGYYCRRNLPAQKRSWCPYAEADITSPATRSVTAA